jgi:hypothetical protein
MMKLERVALRRPELHGRAQQAIEALRRRFGGRVPEDIADCIAFYTGGERAWERAGEHVIALAQAYGLELTTNEVNS